MKFRNFTPHAMQKRRLMKEYFAEWAALMDLTVEDIDPGIFEFLEKGYDPEVMFYWILSACELENGKTPFYRACHKYCYAMGRVLYSERDGNMLTDRVELLRIFTMYGIMPLRRKDSFERFTKLTNLCKQMYPERDYSHRDIIAKHWSEIDWLPGTSLK